MAGLSPQFLTSLNSAYAAAKARMPNPDTLNEVTRYLADVKDLKAAKAAIAEDVAPSR